MLPFFQPLPGCEKYPSDSDEYWGCFGQSMASTLYHPVGTCKMAPESDPEGVVTPRLK